MLTLHHPCPRRLLLAFQQAMRSRRTVLCTREGVEVRSSPPARAAAMFEAYRISGCGQIRAINCAKEPANDA